MKTLKEAKEHSLHLQKEGSSDRREIWDKIDEMIALDWKDKPSLEKDPNIKFTPSPQARNTFLGAKRLLTATAPIIKIPRSKNDEQFNDYFDSWENMLKAIWELSGKFAGRPIHYDLVDQLLRYDECQLLITDTKDLKILHKGGSKAEKYRYDRLAEQTPYIFQATNVRDGWWEADGLGLTAYFKRSKFSFGQAMTRFGEKAMRQAQLDMDNTNVPVYYCDYWDLDVHFAWLSNHDNKYPESDELMVGKDSNGAHNLPVIPIVCQVAEASRLEQEHKFSRQPLLYGVLKSNLWQRLNMLETHLFTNLHNISLTPMFKHTRAPQNHDSEVDFDSSGPVNIISLEPGDDLQPLQREAINMDMSKGLLEARQIFDESSIYPQTFGQPLGGQQAFSTVALLSQSGRLPLVSVQQCGGFAIATAFEKVLALMKDGGGVREAIWLNEKIMINPKDLPTSINMEVTLDAELPTDQLKQATMAVQLAQADLVSNRFIRENILKVNDPTTMSKEIYSEVFDDMMMQELLKGTMREEIQQELMAQMQAQAQQAQAQQMQQMQQMQGPPPVSSSPLGPGGPGGPPTSGMDSYGGLPPSEAGMMPATRPGEKPVPYGTGDGGIQGGEM